MAYPVTQAPPVVTRTFIMGTWHLCHLCYYCYHPDLAFYHVISSLFHYLPNVYLPPSLILNLPYSSFQTYLTKIFHHPIPCLKNISKSLIPIEKSSKYLTFWSLVDLISKYPLLLYSYLRHFCFNYVIHCPVNTSCGLWIRAIGTYGENIETSPKQPTGCTFPHL